MGRRSIVLGIAVLVAIAAGVAIYVGLDGDDPGGGEATATSTNESGETSDASATTGTYAPPDSTTTSTTLAPAEDPDSGQDESDPVPLGQAVIQGLWEIGVANADLDATDAVTAMYDFNEPPADGQRYVLVQLSGTNISDEFAEPVFDVAVVNDDFRHSPTFNECGQIAGGLIDVDPQGPGSHMTANICFLVPEDEVTEDMVLTLGFFDEEGMEKFFSLR